MPINNFDFAGRTVGADVTPPAGYSKTAGSGALGIVSLADPVTPRTFFAGPSSSSNSVWRDDTVLTGAVRKARITTGITNGNGVGPALLDAGNDGYVALTSDGTGNTRLFKIVDSQIGAQVGSSITKTHADNQVRELRWETGGVISMWDGSTQIGTNITDTTYTPIYAAALSRGGRIRSMASEYVAAQSVTSINGGNPIVQGSASVPAVLSGFTSRPTSITTNQTGLTVSNIGGTTNAPTFDVSGWTEGAQYPSLPVSASFTFTFGSESASGTQTITHPAGYVKLTLSGAITDNDDSIAKYFADAGHVAEGGEFEHLPYGDLVFTADGYGTTSTAGTVVGVFRPSSGATAGRVFQFTFNISAGGEITGAEWMRPVEAAPIKMASITMRAI